MNVVLQPWQLLFAILSGWIHSRQQQIIEFQNDQVEALLTKLGLNDSPFIVQVEIIVVLAFVPTAAIDSRRPRSGTAKP